MWVVRDGEHRYFIPVDFCDWYAFKMYSGARVVIYNQFKIGRIYNEHAYYKE